MAKSSGIDEVVANLNKEIALIEGRSRKGLFKAALFLFGKSQEEVPVMDGNLRASGYVASDVKTKGDSVYIGYHAVYAAKVHENPRSGKTGGVSPSGRPYKKWAKVGKWKFLEDPIKKYAKLVVRIIAANAKV